MNTMTQAHLEGLYVQTHRYQEGTKSTQKILRNGSKMRRSTTNPLPHTSIACKAKADQTNKNLHPTVGSRFVAKETRKTESRIP